jgi:hypothetical protein
MRDRAQKAAGAWLMAVASYPNSPHWLSMGWWQDSSGGLAGCFIASVDQPITAQWVERHKGHEDKTVSTKLRQ